MINPLKDFSDPAKDLSRNPLGIIALFIVLVYSFACLLFGFSAKHLNPSERIPFIWFTTLFPVLVLFIFFWLVTRHHWKLYNPKDFHDDESFFSVMGKNQKKPTKTQVSDVELKDLMSYGGEFEAIKKQEKAIKEDLKKRTISYSSTPTEEVLLHQLAAAQVLAWFEKIYNTLFGSQITLLETLNGNRIGITYPIASQFFERVKSRYPSELGSWNIDSYLSYLIISNLIIQQDDKVCITTLGVDFLMWLTKSGYPKTKIF